MEKFDVFKVDDITQLKQNTIYFFLKNAGISENQIKGLRKPNKIKLNGVFCAINAKIQPGDVVEISQNTTTASKILPCEGNLDVIFEDEDYLIINKPHNLATIPTRSHFAHNLGGMIVNYLQDENFVLRVLNRLDKDTAGIVIIAKNTLAANRTKDIKKTYFALATGRLEQQEFDINTPILTICENGVNQRKRVISPAGKPAHTHVQLIKNFENHCLVKLTLSTGRTHQIRVHMQSIGHPLLGDEIYNPSHASHPHTMLILKEISFSHFRTGKTISLNVPFPEIWKKDI